MQLLIPDNASEHVKLTVTFVLFQPAPLAAGERDPLIDGAVLSSFTVTDPLPELPRRSLAVAVLMTPALFAETLSVAGVGPEATPEPASLADQAIETLLLFQPAAFGPGETPLLFVSLGSSVGPVLSRTYEAVPEPLFPVHLF